MNRLSVLLLLLTLPVCIGATWYVDADCPGGDGSELDPYCSVQTAIDNAVDMDEIVVAPGTYLETIDFLGKAITVRSSDGAEATVIDGQGAGSVVFCGSQEGSGTVLQGFTITGGTGTSAPLTPGSGSHRLLGGGMYVGPHGNPTVIDCVLQMNSAEFGGGIFIGVGGGATVSGSTMTLNDAFQGGGIFCWQSSLVLSDSCLAGNTASYAGGLAVEVESIASVSNCIFEGNAANFGGGFGCFYSTVTVDDCSFSGNTAVFGGAMYITLRRVSVVACTLTDNTAAYGGAIVSDGGSPTLVGCMLTGNTATDTLLGGGGILNLNSDPTVANCTFSGNSAAGVGGAMFNASSSPTVTNCTFVGNESAEGGGAVANSRFEFRHGSNPTLTNCILWSNGPLPLLDDHFSAVTVTHSLVQGCWAGHGNINGDPLFVDAGSGDFRLSAGSPCIDAGNNWGVAPDFVDLDSDDDTLELTPLDLGGSSRIAADPATIDSGCGIPVVVDVGAYEFQGDPMPSPIYFADLNLDGFLGVADLIILGSCIGSDDSACCAADLDLDGEVGASDLLLAWASIAIEPSPVQ